MIFTGDAAKNRAEMLSRTADASYDAGVSARSIEMIWDLWRHDMPMVHEDGRARYIGKREAAIKAWFGDDLARTRLFHLVA